MQPYATTVAFALGLILVGCGGSSSRGAGDPPVERWRPAAGAVPETGSYVYLESDPGDPIGGGATRTYSSANAWLYVAASNSGVAVNVGADGGWRGSFQPPAASGGLQPGDYANLQRFPAADPTRGGLAWDAAGTRCDLSSAWVVVDGVVRAADGAVTAVDLRFEQRCAGSPGALHGQVHWRADDLAVASGPGAAAPATLWRPETGSVPSSGAYVYLESDPGDDVGAGRSYLYTPSSARISVTAAGDGLFVKVLRSEGWAGAFQLPTTAGRLQPGFYGDARHVGFQEAGQPALEWLGGQAWPLVTGAIGWLAIDAVTYDRGILTGIDLRFEQHYESSAPALHGAIHWTGPWQPPAGAPPGSSVYLESDPGEFVGRGEVYAYTPDMAHLSVGTAGAALTVTISRGDEWWSGRLSTSTASGRIERGSFAVPLSDSGAADAITWSHGAGNEGGSSDAARGWIIVDEVVYAGDTLASVALRFESGSQGASGALRGAIRWADADAMPGNLWSPAPGAAPASGNYVYLESEPADPIAAGQRLAYTEASGALAFHQGDPLYWGAAVSVDAVADQLWRGDFQVSWFLGRFEKGFYGHLSRLDFDDLYATKLYWRGEGRGCSAVTGWLAVDRAEYLVNALTALDLRFEQRCDGAAGALHGQLHWSAAEPPPSAPVTPPPPTAWRPPAGAVPSTGSYAFLQSDPGDFIGGGGTYLYTPDAYRVAAAANGRVLAVEAAGWHGQFQSMPALAHLAPGFYGGVDRFLSASSTPRRGALDWSGYGRGCNSLSGWFVVDDVTYVDGILTGVDLRFEQDCEDSPAALRGAVRWAGDVWRPAPGSTPAAGNYVYLESDPGNYVGGGKTYTYLQNAVPFTVSATANVLSVGFPGSPGWIGRFRTPGGAASLAAGTYADLGDYFASLGDPAQGGLVWEGDGRAATGAGWFIVDRVVYAAGALSGIDLRFEQRVGAGPALHGQIHYDAP